jgi:hypothetical protein
MQLAERITLSSFAFCMRWQFAQKMHSRTVLSVIYENVGFEVLIAVITKSSIFRGISSCSPLKVNGRFGGTYLRLQAELCFRAGFFLSVFFEPEDRGNMYLRNIS